MAKLFVFYFYYYSCRHTYEWFVKGHTAVKDHVAEFYGSSTLALARAFCFSRMAVCPNPSRLTVYTGIRENLQSHLEIII